MFAGGDGAGAELQDLRDLRVAQALDFTEMKDGALLFGKLSERREKISEELRGFERPIGALRRK